MNSEVTFQMIMKKPEVRNLYDIMKVHSYYWIHYDL